MNKFEIYTGRDRDLYIKHEPSSQWFVSARGWCSEEGCIAAEQYVDDFKDACRRFTKDEDFRSLSVATDEVHRLLEENKRLHEALDRCVALGLMKREEVPV